MNQKINHWKTNLTLFIRYLSYIFLIRPLLEARADIQKCKNTGSSGIEKSAKIAKKKTLLKPPGSSFAELKKGLKINEKPP